MERAAPLWFDTHEELDRAVADVAALSPAARRLLGELVRTQGVTVERPGAGYAKLEELGFAFVRRRYFEGPAEVAPSLWGEEALDEYERRKEPSRPSPQDAVRAALLSSAQTAGRAELKDALDTSRQFMHGACSLLAAHLRDFHDLEVVVLEGRYAGQGWSLRHAMASPSRRDEIKLTLASTDPFSLPVIDAAGGGTVRDRLHLYPDEEVRLVLADSPECSVAAFWRPSPGRPSVDISPDVERMPALQAALADLADPASLAAP